MKMAEMVSVEVDLDAVRDWLVCCYHNKKDPDVFLRHGYGSINSIRTEMTEHDCKRIQSSIGPGAYDLWCKVKRLQDIPKDKIPQKLLNMSLYAGSRSGDVGKVKEVLKQGADPNWHNIFFVGQTPLITASELGYSEVVQVLLSAGAQVNESAMAKWTSLHFSTCRGHLETTRILILGGANINAIEVLGDTPAHLAAKKGNLKMIQLLHQHGADMSLRDKYKKTPLDRSRQRNHADVTAYLESIAESKPTSPKTSSQSSIPPSLPSEPKPATLSPQPSSPSPELTSPGVVGTQNISLVKQHIEQQGSLKVRSLKSFLIGPSRVGKTTARRRLTEEITNISRDEIVPSTGIDAPLTVQLYHGIEQSSVLLSEGWHCQGLEEQCRTLCSHVLKSPATPVPSSSSSTISQPTPLPSGSSTPVGDHHDNQPVSKLTDLFKRAWDLITGRSPAKAATTKEETTAAQSELFTALTSLVKAKNWESIREFLKDIQALVFLHIVDIGGQPEFHEILPLLLHGSALNLIFLNVTQDLDSPYTVVYREGDGSGSTQYTSEFTIREVIQRALCTISSLQTSEKHKPAAILVGTHFDLTSEAAVLVLDRSIQESFKDADFMKNDVLCSVNKPEEEKRYIHPLDNVNKDSSDIKELRWLITTIVNDRFPPEEVPTGALLLQLILRMKFNPHPGWCTLEQCVKIADSCGISRADLLHKHGILQYLHDSGTILHYRNLVHLGQRVITNTNIIMGPPARLFIVAFGAKKTEPETAKRIRATGEIPERLMRKVCSNQEEGEEEEEEKEGKASKDEIPMKEIVELLVSRCILYKDFQSAADDTVYFMPSLLYPDHKVTTESSDPSHINDLSYPPILFVPSIGLVPFGQFSATVVELSNHWRLDEVERFRNRIQFYPKLNNGRVLHVELRTLSTHLEFRIVPPESSEPIDPCLMTECRSKLWEVFGKVALLFSHTKKVMWQLGFYCTRGLKSRGRPHPAICLATDNPQEMICSEPECGKRRLIALDKKHKCWFTEMPITKTAKPPAQGDCGVTTPSTQEPAKQPVPHQSGDSDRVSLFQFMETVASKIPDKWYIVGVALGEHHLANPLICFSDVYEHWQQMSTPQQPSNWSSLVTALNSDLVAEKVLARFIQDNFM